MMKVKTCSFFLIFSFFFLFSSISCGSNTGKLLLTVAYCPTYFTGKGALVEFDPSNGNFQIINSFNWPNEIIGCPLLETPTITLDREKGLLFMFFLDPQILTVIDVNKGSIAHTVTPRDIFFTGFENMGWSKKENVLKGVSGTATQTGYCSDGCFQFGDLNLGGKYTKKENIPFKAMLDDSHLLDETNNIFWIQGSYDLRENTRCAPQDEDLCLLSIDSSTGALNSAKWTNWTIYKYGPKRNENEILAWIEGFETLCKHPYSNFLFASVDLKAAKAQPIACIPQNVTVQMDEWISSFSLDGTLFATGSGDSETGKGQLLVFDTTTGKTTLDLDLSKLADALHSTQNLFVVWSVDWI